MKNRNYDWAAVERDYRTGQYSLRQLETMHGPQTGTISKRAKREGWTKDLSKKVKDKTKDILIAGKEESSVDRPSDDDIINAAAMTAASVVFQHRSYAASCRSIIGKMLNKMDEQLDKGNITVDTNDGPITIDIPLDYLAKAATGLTTSLEKIVKIERRAFNMDAEKEDKPFEQKLTDEQLDERIRRLTASASS
jgi:hypothetical protein